MAAATMSLRAPVSTRPQCEGLSGQGRLAFSPLSKRSPVSSRSRVVMSAGPVKQEESNTTNNGTEFVAQLTALALATSAVLPDVAEAAITPSLKNLLLSVAAGFGVLAILIVAVLGVATFDPVKRS